MTTDILMRMKKDGNFLGIPGETLATVDKQDELTKDFTPGKFVEIKDFSFGISLVDQDMPGPSQNRQGEEITYDGKFKKFIQGANLKLGAGQELYPVTFDEVSVELRVDSSTTILLQSCFNTKSLNQVSIVKRKSAGTGTSTGNIPYLRVDFDDVLITDMSFSIGDDTVKEDMKFVYRTLTLRYRPQNNDGSPGVVVNVGPLSLVNTNTAKSGS